MTFTLSSGESDIPGHVEHAPGPVSALYVPVAHSEHGPPSGPVEPALHEQAVRAALPGGDCECCGHDSQAVAPAGEYRPAPHCISLVAPTSGEYVPPAHGLQFPAPENALYVPAAHSVHVSASGPEAPALHAHAALPPGELEFCRQRTHGPVLGPVAPALHEQAERAALPGGDHEFCGHDSHAVLSAVAYESAAQLTHAPAPARDLNVPLSHGVHVSLPRAAVYSAGPHSAHGPVRGGPVQPSLHTHPVEPVTVDEPV